jgi:hypothetical protein
MTHTKTSLVVVNSWSNLIEELFLDSYRETLKRYRSPYVFRGQTKEYPLVPGIQRLNHPSALTRQIERRIFDSFRKYSHLEVPPNFNEWQWLALAQHYRLPTRLLDWTFSPFVALHFATSNLNQMDDHGVVWCVDLYKTHQYLPPKLAELLTEGAGVFTTDQLNRKFPDFGSFDTKEDGQDFVLFFEPPSLDRRIINQVALFSFMSRPDTGLNSWLERKSVDSKGIFKKIVIPASLKWEIRDKLDQANVNERVLFPGLDGLSDWLRRWYSPKTPPRTAAPSKSASRNSRSREPRKTAAASPPPAIVDSVKTKPSTRRVGAKRRKR